MHHQERKTPTKKLAKGRPVEPTYRSHRRQAHLLLSPGALEQPLLVHFGQQHAEVCGKNCTYMCSEHTDTHLAANEHLANLWTPPVLNQCRQKGEQHSTKGSALVISSRFLTSANPLYLLRLHIQRVGQMNYILLFNYIYQFLIFLRL